MNISGSPSGNDPMYYHAGDMIIATGNQQRGLVTAASILSHCLRSNYPPRADHAIVGFEGLLRSGIYEVRRGEVIYTAISRRIRSH